MEIEIQKGFEKDARRMPTRIQQQAALAIQSIIIAVTFSDVPHLRQLSGYTNYYRIKIGQYRIGLFWDGKKFLIESIGVRGDFYKKYPPD